MLSEGHVTPDNNYRLMGIKVEADNKLIPWKMNCVGLYTQLIGHSHHVVDN